MGFSGNVLGRSNAAAGTAYYGVVPGRANAFTGVASFTVTSGNTANDVYFLRPLGRANVTVAATTSDSALTLDASGSALSTIFNGLCSRRTERRKSGHAYAGR